MPTTTATRTAIRTIAVTERTLPAFGGLKQGRVGYRATVAERTQRKIERRTSVIVVAIAAVAIVVAGLWLLLPLTLS